MNLEQFKNATVGKVIGYGSSMGECGGYASYWFSELTNNKYQFAYGKPNISANWAIGSDCATAWNVASQSNWGAIGFEIIWNPTFSQLKAGDIFFISARSGLSTGHVGVVYSVANNNVTTLEQNFGGARYVQFMAGANSWSYYGGFTCVVRPKQSNTNSTEEEEEDMKIIQITNDADYYGKKYGKNSCFAFNGEDLRYIERPQTLEQLNKLGFKVRQMSSVELLLIIQDLGLKIVN